MTNYSNGKIYKIESMIGDKIYIGSTTKEYLSQRMTWHRSDYKKWLKGKHGKCMIFDMFEEYGLDNCQITLIENYPCESRDQLTSRESHFIRTLDCVNKLIVGEKSKAEQKHHYYINNKEEITKKQSTQHQCECGVFYRHSHKARHQKSKRHLENVIINV